MAFFRNSSPSAVSTSNTSGPKFLSEYSMGQYDFERYHQLLIMADFLANEVLNKNAIAIKPFYAKLIVLYSNFRPLVYNKGKWEKYKKECEELMKEWGKKSYTEGKNLFPVTLADKLIDFWQELLLLKQIIGLGSVVKKNESLRTKLNRAAGVGD